jgi:hypothetical protein
MPSLRVLMPHLPVVAPLDVIIGITSAHVDGREIRDIKKARRVIGGLFRVEIHAHPCHTRQARTPPVAYPILEHAVEFLLEP